MQAVKSGENIKLTGLEKRSVDQAVLVRDKATAQLNSIVSDILTLRELPQGTLLIPVDLATGVYQVRLPEPEIQPGTVIEGGAE